MKPLAGSASQTQTLSQHAAPVNGEDAAGNTASTTVPASVLVGVPRIIDHRVIQKVVGSEEETQFALGGLGRI